MNNIIADVIIELSNGKIAIAVAEHKLFEEISKSIREITDYLTDLHNRHGATHRIHNASEALYKLADTLDPNHIGVKNGRTQRDYLGEENTD
jgi:hypothetical protein